MKKSYRFSFIPGVEFIEENGFYYTASDDPLWPKAAITMAIIEGLAQYERVNDELETKLKNSEFTISVLNDRISSLEATLKQKDKEIEEHKNAVSVLQEIIESTKEIAENERKHRDGLIKEKDEEIEALTKKLKNEIANNPIAKSPIPLSSASDCYDLYICTPDHITYGHIAGEFGVGLYVGDTLLLLKGDKVSEAVRERNNMIDRINTLETTLKKKDETIEKLRNTAEFANRICDGYGALTDTLMSRIEEKNSEIKVLSDQVTRLMDQLKEAMDENSGCESCCDICGNTDCEHQAETEGKFETNLDKVLHDMFISAWLEENTDMPHKALTEWL